MNKNKNQICECGHDKSFHEIDSDGWCIYGLEVYTKFGILEDWE